MAEAIDFSQTQRIVLLIDLNPLLHLQNPNPYLTAILTSAQTLLNNFPFLSSSSLSSFKLFFSSLSPLLSSSKLPIKPSLSLSFDHPSNTLLSLSKTLNSLPSLVQNSGSCPPHASLIASSLRQILHDYAWDYRIDDELSGKFNCTPNVRSNLVVLFSPLCEVLNCLGEFLDLDPNIESLMNVDLFVEKFCGVFDSVNDAFVSYDMHMSWVDVKFNVECDEKKVKIDGSESKFGFLEKGIKSLGWGFCSSDSIVLGSALVPFGLIYPMIGVSSNWYTADANSKKIHVQLSLEIADVNGKPLECKCCELDLIDRKIFARSRCDGLLQGLEFINSQNGADDQDKTFWDQFGDGITKFHINAVQKIDESVRIEGCLSHVIVVHESSRNYVKDEKLNSEEGEFFADKVLKMLTMEMGEYMQKKVIPIWQILLSVLYREGYSALVYISNNNGGSCMGVLKPFTVYSAFLLVMDSKLYPHGKIHNSELNLSQLVRKKGSGIPNSNVGVNNLNGFVDSQSLTTPTEKDVALEDVKLRNKRTSHAYQDLTWSSFCNLAFRNTQMDLEGIYFARECKNSKKLKFLKCWTKQIRKIRQFSLTELDGSKPHLDIPKEIEERLTGSQQESEPPVSSSISAGEDVLSGASRIQDEAALDFCSETSEVFFSNLSKSIKDGLESELDLRALAERLVRSSINWLYQKHEKGSTSDSQTPTVNPHDTCDNLVAGELTKLLLREPKDLAAKHKNNDPYPQASGPTSAGIGSDIIVREYDLQILFRMEILQSEIAASFDESRKQKFVKQICLLLEKMQCHREGGFFGDWNLDNYVGRVIKSRYFQNLGDVVNKIYTKMELLLFRDEDVSPNTLLNSKDSNQSWRDKLEKEEKVGSNRTNQSVSANDESFQPQKNKNPSPQRIKREEHAHRLIEAQQRRERARRFASFTSWVPDLQRVWAPKQLKPMIVKSDSSQKLSKRKNRRRTSYETVYETPMTGNKRSCPPKNSPGNKEDLPVNGGNSCNSVSKALFQDDC